MESLLAWTALIVIVGLPIAWFVSEFVSERRFVRCTLGVLAMLCSFGVALIASQLTFNAWYGTAAKELIDATVAKLETGQPDVVLREFKALKERYQPTYENTARFDELATETANKILAGDSGNAVRTENTGQSVEKK